MVQTPKVSVVMITYNHENYIVEAMNGIFIQECNFDIELIISNDSSKDKTNKIINEVIQETIIPDHIKIRYYNHLENKGMMPNFIWALRQAKGEYVALCEGDDYWTDPYKLQKQVNFLQENEDFVLSAHDAWVIYEDEKKEKIAYSELSSNVMKGRYKDVFNIGDIFKGWFLATASVCFRNVELDFPDFMNTVYSGDTTLFCLLAQFGKISYSKEKMSVYRKNNGGVTAERVKKLGDTYINLLHMYQHLNVYYNFKYNEEMEEAIQLNCYDGIIKLSDDLYDFKKRLKDGTLEVDGTRLLSLFRYNLKKILIKRLSSF